MTAAAGTWRCSDIGCTGHPGDVQAWERCVVDEETTLFGPTATATFNVARTHRFLLTRTWGEEPLMTWIMLNPSTADAFADDPTIRRCTGFAKREGCGGIQVLNLYAVRATRPEDIWGSPDPVGPCNDQIIDACACGGLVVAGWGSYGAFLNRGRVVGQRLAAAGVDLLCLGVTGGGQPRHPLYLPGSAPLLPWTPPREGAGDG